MGNTIRSATLYDMLEGTAAQPTHAVFAKEVAVMLLH